MKKLIIFMAFVLTFVSCGKMKYDLCFNKDGGTLHKEMEIDGNTLKIQSGSKCSDTPWWQDKGRDDESFYVELEWVYAYYLPTNHLLYIYVGENTTGHVRYFTVSGSLNGKETSFTYRQNK